MKKTSLLIVALFFLSLYSYSCTIFMSTDGQVTLVGNNEDGTLEEAVMVFVPAEKGKYGRFYFLLPENAEAYLRTYPQGGMNDQGLVFDITATPLKTQQELVIPPDTPYCEGNLVAKVLAEAANVQEAIDIVLKYKASADIRKMLGVSEFRQMQLFLADRSGESAVIGIGKDSHLVVTRKVNRFQVLANFSLANRENSLISEHYRYDTANEMLEQNPFPSINYFRRILSAIHVEGMAATIYSSIYDLSTGDIYLYNFHDYETLVKMSLNEELAKGERTVKISSLFPRKVFAKISMEELSQKIRLMQQKLIEYQKKVEYCEQNHQQQK